MTAQNVEKPQVSARTSPPEAWLAKRISEMVVGVTNATAPRKVLRMCPRHCSVEVHHAFESGAYSYETALFCRSAEAPNVRSQAERLKAQLWAPETGQTFVRLFEIRGAAGKGGTIKVFTQNLNPRATRVVARNKPPDDKRQQWNFQRNTVHLPKADKMTEYTEAKDALLSYTHTDDARCTVIKSNDKKHTRLKCMLHFLSLLNYLGKKLWAALVPNPLILGSADHAIQCADHILVRP